MKGTGNKHAAYNEVINTVIDESERRLVSVNDIRAEVQIHNIDDEGDEKRNNNLSQINQNQYIDQLVPQMKG